jgi:hypothetical protein
MRRRRRKAKRRMSYDWMVVTVPFASSSASGVSPPLMPLRLQCPSAALPWNPPHLHGLLDPWMERSIETNSFRQRCFSQVGSLNPLHAYLRRVSVREGEL